MLKRQLLLLLLGVPEMDKGVYLYTATLYKISSTFRIEFSLVMDPVHSVGLSAPFPGEVYRPAVITALVSIQAHRSNYCSTRYPFTPGLRERYPRSSFLAPYGTLSTSQMASRTPCCANCKARARPMPLPAPVMRTSLPVRSLGAGGTILR